MPDENRFTGMGEHLEGDDRDGDRDDQEAEAVDSEPDPRSDPVDVDIDEPVATAPGSFQDVVEEQLDAVEAGDLARNATAYDGDLAALLAALEDDREQLETVGEQLGAALDRDVDVEQLNKSALLSLAARLGLQKAAPEAVEALLQAKAERAREF